MGSQSYSLGPLSLRILNGTDNPNGMVSGNLGELYSQVINKTTAVLWHKQSNGANHTGWVQLSSSNSDWQKVSFTTTDGEPNYVVPSGMIIKQVTAAGVGMESNTDYIYSGTDFEVLGIVEAGILWNIWFTI